MEPRPLHASLQDGELLAEDDVLQGEPRSVGGEGADERQEVEEKVHAGGSSTGTVDARREAAMGLYGPLSGRTRTRSFVTTRKLPAALPSMTGHKGASACRRADAEDARIRR